MSHFTFHLANRPKYDRILKELVSGICTSADAEAAYSLLREQICQDLPGEENTLIRLLALQQAEMATKEVLKGEV